MPSNKKPTQKGGKVLGEGSYGCVIYPNIACPKTKSSDEYIGKLVNVNTNDIEPELIEVLRIRNIPDFNEYFAVVEDTCSLSSMVDMNKMKLSQQNDLRRCMNSMDVHNVGQVIQYIQPYGGITFKEFREKNPKQPFTEVVPLYMRLLKCLHVLNENGIQHMDIKVDNIVIHPNTGKLRLIDFGFACFTKDYKNLKRPDLLVRSYPSAINDGYPPWPIEFFAFQYSMGKYAAKYGDLFPFTDKIVLSQMEHTMKNTFYGKSSKFSAIFKNNFIEDSKEMIIETFRIHALPDVDMFMIEVKKWKDEVNDTFDVYSAGMLIVKDIEYLIKCDPSIASDAYLEEVYMFVLNRMTRNFYKERATLDECLIELNQIQAKYSTATPKKKTASPLRRMSPSSRSSTPVSRPSKKRRVSRNSTPRRNSVKSSK